MELPRPSYLNDGQLSGHATGPSNGGDWGEIQPLHFAGANFRFRVVSGPSAPSTSLARQIGP